MTGRPVRARTRWEDTGTTDSTGKVVWRTRIGDDLLCEVHRTGAYVGEVRVWDGRGTGSLVFRFPTRLTKDAARGAENVDVAAWQVVLQRVFRATRR